jgi:hypothetical protein
MWSMWENECGECAGMNVKTRANSFIINYLAPPLSIIRIFNFYLIFSQYFLRSKKYFPTFASPLKSG